MTVMTASTLKIQRLKGSIEMKETRIQQISARVVNAMVILESMEQNAKVTIAYAQLLEAKRNLDEIERS